MPSPHRPLSTGSVLFNATGNLPVGGRGLILVWAAAGLLGLSPPLQAQHMATPGLSNSTGATTQKTPHAGGAAPAAPSAAKGKVVLTVQGNAAAGQAARKTDFDMATLEALPQHSFNTATPWFKNARTFSGPLLRDVLAAAGVSGTELRAVALNNYKVNIPMEDVQKWDMLLATRLDGQPMAVRDKGPLFIIYPFHAHEVLRSERFYSRSAWQLRTLEVK